jgi:predicted kinase
VATLYFITGGTAAGKTSYAQHLAETLAGSCFSLEDWLFTLYPVAPSKKSADWLNERILRCETLGKRLAEQALRNRQTVIFDFGLTTERQRERFYRWARSNGVSFKLHYLDVPAEVRWLRVSRRNDELSHAREKISREAFLSLESAFERPSALELAENSGIRLIPEKA